MKDIYCADEMFSPSVYSAFLSSCTGGPAGSWERDWYVCSQLFTTNPAAKATVATQRAKETLKT